MATNAADLEQGRLARCPELFERLFDRLVERGHETNVDTGCRSGCPSACEKCVLLWREPFTARVREQSIETPRRVSRMKPDRRGAAWTSPHLIGRQSRDARRQLFTTLKQAVGDRLQQRRESGKRPAQPHFRLRHRLNPHMFLRATSTGGGRWLKQRDLHARPTAPGTTPVSATTAPTLCQTPKISLNRIQPSTDRDHRLDENSHGGGGGRQAAERPRDRPLANHVHHAESDARRPAGGRDGIALLAQKDALRQAAGAHR